MWGTGCSPKRRMREEGNIRGGQGCSMFNGKVDVDYTTLLNATWGGVNCKRVVASRKVSATARYEARTILFRLRKGQRWEGKWIKCQGIRAMRRDIYSC